MASPRLEYYCEKEDKAQANRQDRDDQPPEIHTDEDYHVGGDAGCCDIEGGGGRKAETRGKESLSAKLSQEFDRKASELHIGQGPTHSTCSFPDSRALFSEPVNLPCHSEQQRTTYPP